MYVECAAALAQAHRMERLTATAHRRALALRERLWSQLDVIELDQEIAVSAARCAHQHALRRYDAVHCASAALIQGPDVVAAARDQRLLTAWSAVGLATYDCTTN